MNDFNNLMEELKPRPHDLVVVPLSFNVPENPPFLIHKMKYLLTPSIIRSGVTGMSFFEKMSTKTLWDWLAGKKENPEEKDAKVLGAKKDRDLVGTLSLSQAIKDLAKKNSQVIPPPKFFRYTNSKPKKQLDVYAGRAIEEVNRVAFYVEMDPDTNTFAFSYAICHRLDRFQKKIARQITTNRFNSGDWYEIKDYDPKVGAMGNIKMAIANLLSLPIPDKMPSSVQPSFSSISEKRSDYELLIIFHNL